MQPGKRTRKPPVSRRGHAPLASEATLAGAAAPGGGAASFSEAQAEAHLRSLELFGMRFGLDRMRRMMTVLDSPQRRLDAIHVLGTNGKTSTTRMIAAILARHGLRTAAYTSPHLIAYRERLALDGREIDPAGFAAAVARAARAAERVNRTLGEDDHVTQFELLTAAAFAEMARRQAQVAVVEAGLGGRYDATSVIEARVTVLTNVGLEHTRWLGSTVNDIAEEKLAVLAPQGTLVLGAGLAPQALAVAERVAGERGARIVHAPARAGDAPLRARGAFQQRNFALARAAAEVYLQGAAVKLDERAVREAAQAVEVPGRLQLLEGEPPTVLDGAHNPDAVAALADSLGALIGDRPLALVLGVLEDKDAATMLALLLGRCARAWFTAPASSRALSPAALQSLARQQGFERALCEPRPERALAQAREWARAHGGAVLATGSVYLVGELLGRLAQAAPAQAATRRGSASR